MQVKILGCGGGIGDGMFTTAMLVDEDILIDAGTGVGTLSLDALINIDHIFITHTHMDHIAYLPLLLDTIMGLRTKPIKLYASKQVIAILKAHIFNWLIWPDFNMIPTPEMPLLIYQAIELGQVVELNQRKITALPANHAVPAVGYLIDSGQASLAFTGDTAECEAFWSQVNTVANLKYLIIETAFSNQDAELAIAAKHLCPSTLAIALEHLDSKLLDSKPLVYITHLKPGEGVKIMEEIALHSTTKHCVALATQQVFEL